MGKNKQGTPLARGKSGGGGGGVKQPASGKQQRQAAPGLTKDAAGNFLKQRMGMKLKDLRAPGLAELASKPVAVAAGDVEGVLGCLKAQAEKRGCDFAEQEACEEQVDTFVAQEGLNREREAENTRRKFYVELRKVLAAAEVIVEVLDARDPQACRNFDLEKQVTSAGKRLVLLLNKIDLVPKHIVDAWIKHLKRSFPALAFKAAHGGARRPIHANTSALNAPDGLLQSTHAVVGADELMQLLKNYARIGDGSQKAHVTVGIVGYPNTGKSSVINSMKRHCCVETGGKAGVTKIMQEISLDSKVTLIDCPGIVFEGSSADPSVVLRNVVRVENVPDAIGVVDALILKAPRASLLKFYGLQRDFSQGKDFLIHVAQTRGKLKRGGGLDLEVAAKAVISDWTTGKFRYYAVPPAESASAESEAVVETVEIVSRLSAAIDIDALCGGHGAMPVVLGAPAEDDGMEGGGGCDVHMG